MLLALEQPDLLSLPSSCPCGVLDLVLQLTQERGRVIVDDAARGVRAEHQTIIPSPFIVGRFLFDQEICTLHARPDQMHVDPRMGLSALGSRQQLLAQDLPVAERLGNDRAIDHRPGPRAVLGSSELRGTTFMLFFILAAHDGRKDPSPRAVPLPSPIFIQSRIWVM